MTIKLHITYNPFATNACTPDGAAEQKANEIRKQFGSSHQDMYVTTSNALVIDWLRLLIHRGRLDHTRVVLYAPHAAMDTKVIMNEENIKQTIFNKNGRYQNGTGPVCYSTDVLSKLLEPNPWDE